MLKHVLIVFGRPKGHGKNRKNIPEFIIPTNEIPKAATNVANWFVENYKGLGPFPEELK